MQPAHGTGTGRKSGKRHERKINNKNDIIMFDYGTISSASVSVKSFVSSMVTVLKKNAVYLLIVDLEATSRLNSSLKLVYSKQPTLGLTQEFCWVRTCVGG